MDQNEEILKMVEQAQDGYWFPMAVVGSLLGLIILLLLAFWKQSQKRNDKRHTENEEIIHGISANATTQAVLNTKLTLLVERNIEDIKEIKSKLK